ncbi:hypothetical protein A9R05_12545 [Burkholderia sp. KK1]|nr:hypothetical protein A9R05_12545 [Burkholderia sp. KK1]
MYAFAVAALHTAAMSGKRKHGAGQRNFTCKLGKRARNGALRNERHGRIREKALRVVVTALVADRYGERTSSVTWRQAALPTTSAKRNATNYGRQTNGTTWTAQRRSKRMTGTEGVPFGVGHFIASNASASATPIYA